MESVREAANILFRSPPLIAQLTTCLRIEVNRPGGIATDNFHVFWSNKAIGSQVAAATPWLNERKVKELSHVRSASFQRNAFNSRKLVQQNDAKSLFLYM